MKIEEVDEVAQPPRARVEVEPPSFQRKVDYLDGFLKAPPPVVESTDDAIQQAVIEALKEIYDPEIPVNIYELGLIYGVEVDQGHVHVNMTLTTPHCPVAESMPAEVEIRVGAVPGVGVVDVDLVWDPAWDPSKMSDEARLELGML